MWEARANELHCFRVDVALLGHVLVGRQLIFDLCHVFVVDEVEQILTNEFGLQRTIVKLITI